MMKAVDAEKKSRKIRLSAVKALVKTHYEYYIPDLIESAVEKGNFSIKYPLHEGRFSGAIAWEIKERLEKLGYEVTAWKTDEEAQLYIRW